MSSDNNKKRPRPTAKNDNENYLRISNTSNNTVTGGDDDRATMRHLTTNKRWKSKVATTPWLDQWELEAVGTTLLSASELFSINAGCNDVMNADRRMPMSFPEALERVEVWKCRAHGSLPHAVESTASLAQNLWREYQQQQQSGCQQQHQQQQFTISCQELRLSYSSAVIRSVNGLADAFQQDRFRAPSVAVSCLQLGLPAWLVDIRHEATHNQLPALAVLRMAAVTLLQFFQSNYWDRLAESAGKEKDRVVELLEAYKRAATFFDAKKRKEEEERKKAEEISDDINKNGYGMNRLGSNFNPFSVLQYNKKKKKKKNGNKNEDKMEESESAIHQSPSKCARNFVLSPLSPAVVLPVTMSFLVWGENVAEATQGSTRRSTSGVLIPALPPTDAKAGSSSTQALKQALTEMEEEACRIQELYRPLLVTIGKAWPGFLPTLLTHLVDCIIKAGEKCEASADKEGSRSSPTEFLDTFRFEEKRKLYFLNSWIRYLMSISFCGYFLKDEDIKTNLDDAGTNKQGSCVATNGTTSPGHAMISSLRVLRDILHYPIQSLYDRCRSDTSSFKEEGGKLDEQDVLLIGRLSGESCRDLKDLFSQILGGASDSGKEDRETNNNTLVTTTVTAITTEHRDANEEKEENDKEHVLYETIQASAVTLDQSKIDVQIKMGVDNSAGGQRQPSNNNHRNGQIKISRSRPRWTFCSSWDPCPIGTVPGFPL